MKNHTPTCADKLKALADTTRLAVLESLMDQPRLVSELLQTLDIEQSLLSHHLAHLREVGLVESTRSGKTVRYQLSPDVAMSTTANALDLGCCQLSFPIQHKKHPQR
ncbi:ArsR/SmtB family transcription factor [Candidatus Nitrospira salsa]